MRDIAHEIVEYAINKGASYADVRVQQTEETLIDVGNSLIKDCFQGSNDGVSVRLLFDGSWGFSASTTPEDYGNYLRTAVDKAIDIARSRGVLKNKVRLAEVKPSTAKIPLKVKEDPRDVSLSEKCSLILDFNKEISGLDKRIVDVRTQFTDYVETQIFCNSEGTYLEFELPRTETNFYVTCREGGESQWVRNRKSKAMGYEFVKEIDLLDQGRDAVQRSIDLLNGDPTPTGKQTVILDPSALGVFIHEAFGHANEADSVAQRRSFLRGLIGKQIASEHVTMWSDPTMSGEVGSYPFDDEGTPGIKTCVIEEGVFKSYMHSRETAAAMNTSPTGNARAQDYSLPPIVRMNNLYMDPGDWNLDEIVGDTRNGILIEGSRGGMEDPERGGFQFSAQNCYMIEHGEIVKPLKDVSISGMTLEVFMNIDAVADNFYLHPGHCGKGEPGVMQSKIVTDGGPYCRVVDILVGGKHV